MALLRSRPNTVHRYIKAEHIALVMHKKEIPPKLASAGRGAVNILPDLLAGEDVKN